LNAEGEESFAETINFLSIEFGHLQTINILSFLFSGRNKRKTCWKFIFNVKSILWRIELFENKKVYSANASLPF